MKSEPARLTSEDVAALMVKPAVAQWEAAPPVLRLIGLIECGSAERAIAKLAASMLRRAISLN